MGSQSAGIGSALPDQTGYSGYILTTDGVTPSWEASSASLPSQTGKSGQYLTTNGTVASWAAVTADTLLPDQTGASGKVLSTDGAGTLSWVDAAGLALGAFSSTPTDDGLTLAAGTLNLDPADGTHAGGVSTAAQTFAGVKTFSDVPVAAGISAPTTSAFTLTGKVTDGGSAIGVIIDNLTALTTSGAKIASFQNAEVEKAYVDKDGVVTGTGFVPGTGMMFGPSAAASSPGVAFAALGYIIYFGNADMYYNSLNTHRWQVNSNVVANLSATSLDLSGLGTSGSIVLKNEAGVAKTITIVGSSINIA